MNKCRVIKLVRHNENWSNDYEQEVELVKKFLGNNLIKAYHIGSTAIANLRAKPIIDILLVVKSLNDIDNCSKNFKCAAYEIKGEFGIINRRFFQKGGNEVTHHIHVYESANPEIERHRIFVEYMNNHPVKVNEYEQLKIKLVEKFAHDPDNYLNGKSNFIRTIDSQASRWKNRQHLHTKRF